MSLDTEQIAIELVDEQVRRILRKHGVRLVVQLELMDPEASVEPAAPVPPDRDLTATMARIRADLAILAERRQAAQTLTLLGELATGIAHDVRNILSTVRGSAKVATRRLQRPEELRELLGLIETEAARAVEITGDLLHIARGSQSMPGSHDANDLITLAARLVRARLDAYQVPVRLVPSPDPVKIVGNRSQLLQVLINLILNSQQAIHDQQLHAQDGPGPGAEEAPGALTLATVARGDRVHISVTDNGPGIPHELRQRIFEPLFTTKPEGNGTGMGLAMSARIVSSHGGQLRVEDAEPRGVRFVVDLPTAPE